MLATSDPPTEDRTAATVWLTRNPLRTAEMADTTTVGHENSGELDWNLKPITNIKQIAPIIISDFVYKPGMAQPGGADTA